MQQITVSPSDLIYECINFAPAGYDGPISRLYAVTGV
jgi:hypothetical protein